MNDSNYFVLKPANEIIFCSSN